ncbi:MAG: pinensin family lanthipeptide [Cyclobacteriaceae bacterium]
MKKRLSIDELNVKSFITDVKIKAKGDLEVKGGGNTLYGNSGCSIFYRCIQP